MFYTKICGHNSQVKVKTTSISWDRNEQAGKDWMIAFMKRHPLSLRKPESCSYARNISFNKHNVGLFFDIFNLYSTSMRPEQPPISLLRGW